SSAQTAPTPRKGTRPADWHSAFETDLEQAADQLSELADRILDRRRREGADNEKKRLGHYVAQLLALLSNLSTAM
ncbi:MAG: hypothetical protein JWM91_5242, partial [Rhodospirillales bacterium]|nr:hypothetical protein [Rhodospirillales bacterium]